MAETIDDITYDYEEDGRQVRRELKRKVLSKGSWSTIMFMYDELDRRSEEWRPAKVAIVRYQKRNGVYRKQSGFNISSEKQARQVIAALEEFYADDGEGDGEAKSD